MQMPSGTIQVAPSRPRCLADPGVDNVAFRRYLVLPRSVRSGFALFGLLAFVISGPGIGCRQQASDSLKSRVQEYWELKQSKQWERIYEDYLDPTRKEALPREAFLKRRLLSYDILTFKILDIQDRQDRATVVVENEVNMPLRGIRGAVEMRKQTVNTEDDWVQRNGTWYVRLSE